LGERQAEDLDRLEPAPYELRPKRRDLLRPRLDRVPPREPAGRTAQRGVALRHSSPVLHRQRGARGKEPSEDAVEVRAADGGSSLDDAEAVRREDERRDGRAELFGGAKRSAVEPGALPFARADRHLHLEIHLAAAAGNGGAGPLVAEADELSVG